MKLVLRDSAESRTEPSIHDGYMKVKFLGVKNARFFDFRRGISAFDAASQAHIGSSLSGSDQDAVLLLAKGWTVKDVAEVILVNDFTVRCWHEEYREGSEDRLLLMRNGGSVSDLNREQQAERREHLIHHTYLCSKDIAYYVEQMYGVKYSRSGITFLLHRMGFVWKNPELIPGNASEEQQREFVESLDKLKKEKAPEDPIYYGDGVHSMHTASRHLAGFYVVLRSLHVRTRAVNA